MTIFIIATLHHNISFSSDKINTGLRFRLPAMTLLEYIFSNVKDIVIRQSFILVSFPRSYPWGVINILLYNKKFGTEAVMTLYMCIQPVYQPRCISSSVAKWLYKTVKICRYMTNAPMIQFIWEYQWFNSFENISAIY